MSESQPPDYDSKNITALGVWKHNFSTILYHKGSTFHKLTLSRNFLNLAETVFALLRTNFVLRDHHDNSILTADAILNQLYHNNKVEDLLKIHVYLGFQSIGICPTSLEDSTPPKLNFDPSHYKLGQIKPNNDKLELHQLLDYFKDRQFNVGYKTTILRPVYALDSGLECFIAMPDSPAYTILDTLTNFNHIVAVSNMESIYFLTLSPVSL